MGELLYENYFYSFDQVKKSLIDSLWMENTFLFKYEKVFFNLLYVQL